MTVTSQVLSVLEERTLTVRIAGLECSGPRYYDGKIAGLECFGTRYYDGKIAGLECSGTTYYYGEDRRS